MTFWIIIVLSLTTIVSSSCGGHFYPIPMMTWCWNWQSKQVVITS